MSSNPFTVCACECVCVCMCAKACQVSTNYLDSSLALFPSMVWQKAKCTHTHTHSTDSISQGYKCSHIQILWLDTHTKTPDTAASGEKNDLKVHLYFFFSPFLCGFLTVVGRLPQIFPALCTHVRLGGKKKKKKCREEMLTDFSPRGETKRKKWRLKLCSAATALT